jgi:hypothetical protein
VLRVPVISCLTFLAIASCGASDPVDHRARDTAGLPDVNVPAPSATGEPHGATEPARAEAAATSKIPASLQGRWALAPRDCTSTRGDAKGLMVITPERLSFFESRAVPASEVNSDGDSISGNFVFTGEGRSWTKYEAVKIEKGALTRTEINPTASFSYAKCS